MTAWDSPTGDPIADLIEGMRMIKDERWICRGCARTLWLSPYRLSMTLAELRRGAVCHVARCADCGATDWLHTMEPVPA